MGEEKEQRIRAITRLYYSNPRIQEALVSFGRSREVVPRYFEGFGKRPDIIQYPSDIMGLVNKGATSFHASEEIWKDPLQLTSDITPAEMNALRTSWDLLIDIDSPFLDWSKIAAQVLIEALEAHGVSKYGIKFSGSKGFHLIIPGTAFPAIYEEQKMSEMFPEWPRAICRYLMHCIRKEYNRRIEQVMPDVSVIQQRTNKSKEELLQAICPDCGRPSIKRISLIYRCPDCGTSIKRREVKRVVQELRCINCPGNLHMEGQEEYFYCEYCNKSSFDKLGASLSSGKVTYPKDARQNATTFSADFDEKVSGEAIGVSDLVLVAPRHLFRMPYSLHEKTTLVSVVLTKTELEAFSPKLANPLTAALQPYLPLSVAGECTRLLAAALAWRKEHQTQEEIMEKKKRIPSEYKPINLEGVTESMFPPAIKKLLQGLKDGKKRGLFILLTFYKSCGFSYEHIAQAVREWNKKNEPPLKEGYLKSQIEWHFKQKKKILPPNYDNEGFYKDLGLLHEKPKTKNPLVDVSRAVHRRQNDKNV